MGNDAGMELRETALRLGAMRSRKKKAPIARWSSTPMGLPSLRRAKPGATADDRSDATVLRTR